MKIEFVEKNYDIGERLKDIFNGKITFNDKK